MAEYIDRNGLIEALNKFAPEHYNALINQLITKYPTADVVEVKHGEWISVEERLPKHKNWVLVWHTGYETPKKAKYKDAAMPMFILDGYDRNDGEVTHWMPLPKGPGKR